MLSNNNMVYRFNEDFITVIFGKIVPLRIKKNANAKALNLLLLAGYLFQICMKFIVTHTIKRHTNLIKFATN